VGWQLQLSASDPFRMFITFLTLGFSERISMQFLTTDR
jgi:hypothetical protein